MSKEKRRVPRLRFPGFTRDWEQRKFGELFDYERPDAYIVKSDNYNDAFNMPVLTANKAFILGYTNEVNSYNKPSIIFDDFTLDRKYVDFPYMLKSSAIKILTSKNQHNLRFLFERLNSTRFEVLGHARHYISVVQNTTTLCPSIDEEVCISNLLTKFDELITLHQRKLNRLILKKKSLLQKLFPKNGDRYPELRFPDFTDAWEQCKLGDVVKSYSGGTPTASNKEYYGGDIPFIRSAEINSDTTELYITQEGLDNSSAKIVDKGTILYAMYGATSGEVGISKINGAINQAILAMIPLEYNSRIIAQYLRKNKESIIGKYLQGGQGNLSANIILELPIQLPGLEESNQIANFLESFDNIITLHQRKLDHLQLQKKALLQQMFV